jgi:hypothetical protein
LKSFVQHRSICDWLHAKDKGFRLASRLKNAGSGGYIQKAVAAQKGKQLSRSIFLRQPSFASFHPGPDKTPLSAFLRKGIFQ